MKEQWGEVLFKKEYPALLLCGLSLTNSRFEAEDLIQEAFYRFLVIYDSLKEENYRGWLFRVMRNYYFDNQRKEKNKHKLIENLKGTYQEETTNLLEELIQSKEREQLYYAIGQLKEPYKEVLIAHYFLDMPIAAISEMTGLARNNVKVLLHRGRKQLREGLKNEKLS